MKYIEFDMMMCSYT